MLCHSQHSTSGTEINMEYKYRLQTFAERDSNVRCPGCGRSRKCFKEYVYTDNGQPVDPETHTCGKCDHESSCGYHLPPKEYFRQSGREERTDYKPQPKKVVKRIEIDIQVANKTRTAYHINSFVRWVRSLPWSESQRERLELALQLYNVGTSKDGGVIWWQIDEGMVVRTGKKMLYNPNTGKRLKDDQGNSIGFNWIHSMMQKQGKFQDTETERWEMVQCLFGEHLLKFNPSTVCIVESEKTVILMSAFDPQAFTEHVWMATGGKYNIQEMKLYPLKHKKVLFYPDKDAVEEWRQKLAEVTYPNMILFDGWIKQFWKPEDGEKADIGDSVLRMIRPSTEAFDEMLEQHPNIKSLVDKFNLELIKTEKLNDE